MIACTNSTGAPGEVVLSEQFCKLFGGFMDLGALCYAILPFESFLYLLLPHCVDAHSRFDVCACVLERH